MRATRFSSATAQYERAKEYAINQTNRTLASQPQLSGVWISGVGTKALADWKLNWSNNPERHASSTHWDWTKIASNDPKSLCAAVWRADDRLNTLAAMTVDKSAVTVRFMEADPGPDALRAGFSSLVITDLATTLARALKKDRIKFDRPVSEELIRHYCGILGFSVERARDRVYCWKDV